MTGFLNREYLGACTVELRELRGWVDAGRLAWRVHVVEGLENFHEALARLFDGSHDGKVILRVAHVE
jgi:NADPH-dependent curcumin reductase CurA